MATLTIDVDDRPEARDDQNAATEGGASVAGNVLGNDVIGDAPGRVTQISFTTTDAAAAAFYAALGDADIVVTENAGVFTVTVAVAEGGVKTFTTLAGGELTIDSSGSYTYVPPDTGDLRENATETFTYTVVDGDGDSDAATLTIDVENVIEPVGALLLTNTNVQDQDLRILITRDDGEIIADELTVRTGTGQESAIELGNGNGDVVFETSFDYAVILKFEGGAGTTNVTNFDLIFDLQAADLDDPDNVFLTLLDQGNIQLGDQGGGADGVIWQVNGDPDDLDGDGEVFAVSPAILYDVELDTALGDSVIFDSDKSHNSFDLDFGLLPTGGDALFAAVEVLDISGSQSDEVNTLTLNAQDVLDVTDPDNMLVVLGDNDVLVLADEGDLQFEASGLTGQTLDGSSETFDIYNVVLDGVTVGTVFVDDDLTVQFETAMA